MIGQYLHTIVNQAALYAPDTGLRGGGTASRSTSQRREEMMAEYGGNAAFLGQDALAAVDAITAERRLRQAGLASADCVWEERERIEPGDVREYRF